VRQETLDFDPAARSSHDELMDIEAVSFEEFRACLQDLSRVNTLTLGRRPVLAFLERALRHAPGDVPVTILDVACGYGDTLRAIREWGERRGRRLTLLGVDLSPQAVRAAREATAAHEDIAYHCADIFAFRPPTSVDLVVSSLFTHHLQDDAIVRFLGWMQAHARLGWCVNDLHRHRVSFHGFRLLARTLRLHRFVQHDGPVSIARGFRPGEWRALIAAAALPPGETRIVRRVPFRICVERLRAAA
jgi:SAM-dependent methyltransferase